MNKDLGKYFPGRVVLIAPHMDDCVLACGGTLAQLPLKSRLLVVYVTDGTRSPVPTKGFSSGHSQDLEAIRTREARQAMALMGIPSNNLRFLGLPDNRLAKNRADLSTKLRGALQELKPDTLLVPFRYDRHPDHLAINRVLTELVSSGDLAAQLIEYFVYFKWRLLSGKDIRRYIHPQSLVIVNTEQVSDLKRQALDCFESQTTRYFSSQTRPTLTPQYLDEVCRSPEYFLPYDPHLPGKAVIARARWWVQLVHRFEPFLKTIKDKWIRIDDRQQGRNAP